MSINHVPDTTRSPNVYLACLLFFIFSPFDIIACRDHQFSLRLARETLLRPSTFLPLNFSHPLTLSADPPRTLGLCYGCKYPIDVLTTVHNDLLLHRTLPAVALIIGAGPIPRKATPRLPRSPLRLLPSHLPRMDLQR